MKNNQNYIFYVKKGAPIYKNIPSKLQCRSSLYSLWIASSEMISAQKIKRAMLTCYRQTLLNCILISNSESKDSSFTAKPVTVSNSKCVIWKFTMQHSSFLPTWGFARTFPSTTPLWQCPSIQRKVLSLVMGNIQT